MTTLYHSIMGLPRSGKTTFLAALGHLISAGEVATRLSLYKLEGNNAYLDSITEAWRRCECVPRTSIASETKISIHLQDLNTNNRFILDFPDLSGESFEEQFSSRRCKIDYINNYEKEGGILLFINADRCQDGITHLDLYPALDTTDVHETSSSEQDWSPKFVPEQVRLVDLLQFLLRPPFVRRLRRVAVLISAWDVILDPDLLPIDWLARELPFLYYFLMNNPELFNFQVFGVSAQGGDIRGEQRAQLARQLPSQRIQCIGSNAEPHDITAPLIWLNGIE